MSNRTPGPLDEVALDQLAVDSELSRLCAGMVWAVLPSLLVATATGTGNELTGWSEEFTTEVVGSGGYALSLHSANMLA